ncbi:MAG: hypothetical protein AABX84_01030 [Nanoarchaeota archaeon]
MEEKIAYIYGQRTGRGELINPDYFNYTILVNGMVETLGGLHVNTIDTVRRFKGYQIVFDKSPSGESIPLPIKLKSKLQIELS